MDRERLGRVLGRGARMAAQTAWEAVDAATSPEPANGSPTTQRVVQQTLIPAAPQRARVVNARSTAPRVKLFSAWRHAGHSLFLEIAGSFFALFALAFAAAVWRSRGLLSTGIAADRNRFYAFCVMALLFGYFSVSSFVRARRKS